MIESSWEFIQSLIGLGNEDLNSGEMAIRAIITYALTIAIVRMGDKRLFGKGTAFDTVVAIMIGSIMSRAITGSSPLLATWVAGTMLIGVHWLIAFLTFHLDWFGPVVKGNPVLLVKDGEVKREGMREGSVSRHDLEQALRAQGAEPDPTGIKRAYLERDGSISVIPAQGKPRLIDVSVSDGVQTIRIALE